MTDVGRIESDGVVIESSEETSEQMLESVKPAKDEPQKFKAVKPIPDEKPKSATSKAASELGKLGGKAAAKARAEREEEEPEEKSKPVTKPAAETDEEPEEEPEEDDTPEVRKSRAAERVKQATREAAEAKRERDKLRTENEELRRARPAAPATPASTESRPEAAQATPKPRWEDGGFKDWDAFMDARDTWNRSEWTREEGVKAAKRAEREQVVGTVKTFQEAIADTIAEDPEFWDKVPEIHDTTPLGQLIVRQGSKSPGILLYLGENPKEYARLSRLTDPYELIDGLGAIKGRIEAQREGATSGDTSSEERPGSNPEFSRAKPPARPPAGSPHIVTGDTGELSEDAPLSAFRADFGKRRAASRR